MYHAQSSRRCVTLSMDQMPTSSQALFELELKVIEDNQPIVDLIAANCSFSRSKIKQMMNFKKKFHQRWGKEQQILLKQNKDYFDFLRKVKKKANYKIASNDFIYFLFLSFGAKISPTVTTTLLLLK